MGYFGGHGHFFSGWLFWLIIIAAIGFIVFLIAKNFHINKTNQTPLDILKKRYAKGEITKHEFEEIKRDL